ncbi:hypothetical protein KIL84_014712, partial [Mauremys mutica]
FLRGHIFTYSHLLLWQKWTIFLTENQQYNAHLIHASRNSYLKSVENGCLVAYQQILLLLRVWQHFYMIT